ncbi:MAG: glycine/sarcosine/betaine reductase selenoprotein B family protein [Candidatus Poribacteria bacterium]
MATLKELDIKLRAFMRFYRYKRYDWTPNAPLKKSLNECRFGLVTTAGLHLPDQPAFDERLKRGDCSYREIPNDIDVQTLQISQKSEAFDKSGIYEDRNLVFPLGRFRELEREKVIGELNHRHFSFMGSITAPKELIETTAPEVAKILKADAVDVVFLTPV